jgi:hypothetical protein
MVLEEDAGFKKYLLMIRMKVGLHNVRAKLEGDPAYSKSDAELFCTQEEIDAANYMMC